VAEQARTEMEAATIYVVAIVSFLAGWRRTTIPASHATSSALLGSGHPLRTHPVKAAFAEVSFWVTTQVVLDSSRKAQGFGEVRWVAG
jgi:hypothetical protein